MIKACTFSPSTWCGRAWHSGLNSHLWCNRSQVQISGETCWDFSLGKEMSEIGIGNIFTQ